MIRRSGVAHAVGQVEENRVMVVPLSIKKFVEMATIIPGFSFARISDGGFFCVMGRKGVNCDNSPYSPEQAQALIAEMEDRTILHGITSIALRVTKSADWIHEHDIKCIWYDADVMSKASDDGMLFPFIEFLQTRRSLLVGAAHLDKLKGFPITSHIVCHPTHAFEEVNELEDEIGFRIDRDDPSTVLLSAGQGASPTLVSRLHRIYPKLVIIDCGSLWDPYVQVFSRSGYKTRGWNEYKRLGRLNFHQNIEDW